MVDNKMQEYNRYRKIIKLLLLFLGLWPSENTSIFYNALPYVQIFLNLGAAFAILGHVQLHFTNVTLTTKSLSIMASFLTGVLKVICITVNRKDAHELHKNLDSYFEEMLNDPTLKDIILDGVTTFRRLSWSVTTFVFISGIVYIFAPIIFIISQHAHDTEPIEYLLPYPGIYPWPISPNGVLYKCHYVFEILATFSLFSLTSSVEPLFSLYVFQMIGQIREMTYRVANINATNEKELGRCVAQFATLLKCRDTLQKIYGPIILWMMCTNAIILCGLIFQLTQMQSTSIGRAVLFAAYIGTKLMQTFIYAWTGTQLIIESERYHEAVYSVDWFGHKRYMTSVLIMLSQRPMVFTACNFSVVSLDIFVMVLNTTVSYFYLLQTLQNEI